MEADILYRSRRTLKVGQIERYVVTYEREDSDEDISKMSLDSLWLKIRNTESIPLRAAYLMGPYILYVDVRPEDYDHKNASFITANQPKYEPNLGPGKSFDAELAMHTIKSKYVWIIDVVSQIIFNPTIEIGFELLIGRNMECLDMKCHKLGSLSSQLSVNRKDTLDLWNLPLPVAGKEIHLVILSHGLHSNTGADMFYIKDQLDKLSSRTGENLIVRGFHGNACKTEKGIKYLGSRTAEYIVNELYIDQISKISFIGHSLGGLVQTFAIAYIEMNFPWFFEKVQPINFITLASPLLGIVTDNPPFVKVALSVGIVGRTGQDLGLEGKDKEEPLLKLLPTGPTHKILKKFRRRTLYANAINDGIVPLYSSALLYLDWRGLSKIDNSKDQKSKIAREGNEDVVKIASRPVEEDVITKVTKSFINPFQKALSLWGPNASETQYSRFQTKNDDQTVSDYDGAFSIQSFPKTSMIESAASVLLPPLPPLKYIIDPNSRADVIIHDKIYNESDIPPYEQRKKSFIKNLDPISKFEDLEEQIAREWHKGMSWRKVLVRLEPDAHNNIFVRRRFANAYGWNVIDHLLEQFQNYENTDNLSGKEEDGSSNPQLETLLNRVEIQKDNHEIDLSSLKPQLSQNDWVNTKHPETMFDVGPTGMLSNFGEILDSFRNWNMASTIGSVGLDYTQTEEDKSIQEELKNAESIDHLGPEIINNGLG